MASSDPLICPTEDDPCFRMLFEDSRDAIFIQPLDDRGVPGALIQVNQKACSLLGYSREELLQMPHAGTVMPEIQERRDWIAEKLKAEGRLVFETGLTAKNGLRIPVECFIGILNVEGKPAVISIFRNLTAQKKAESALRNLERFAAETQRIGRIGGWKANPHTDYLEWTEGVYEIIEEPVSYRPGLTEGLKYFLPRYLPDILKNVINCLSTGEPFAMETEIITAKGKHLWAELRGIAPVEDGERPAVIGTLQDITGRKNVERRLSEQADFNQRVFNSTDIHQVVVGPDGTILAANEAWRRFAAENGAGGENAWGVGAAYFVPYDEKWGNTQQAQQAYEGILSVQQGRLPYFRLEYPCFGKGGRISWFDMHVAPMQGKESTVLISHTNITERKKAEDALRESESLQRILLDDLPAGVIIVDPETRIMERVNDHVAALFGDSVEHLVGRRCHALICPADEGSCPVCDLGKTMDNSEREMLRKDGSLLPVIKTVRRIQLNGREKLLECFVDMSERKKVEKELQDSRQRLEDIVNFLPDATLAIDMDKRIIIWNRAIEEMTGVPASEMIGKGDHVYTVPFYGEARTQLMDLIFMDDAEVAARYPKIVRKGEYLTAEAYCNALYGSKGAWIFAKASPLHDQSGNMVGAIEIVRDINESKQAEVERDNLQAQLNQAQKMESVGRLAGGVAHDFNNMLQSIIGNSEMALTKIDEMHPVHGNLSEVLKAARHSADLTRQLLAFARKQTIKPVILDLNDTIGGMLKMLRRLIGEDIDLSWKPALNLWPVEIDPSQIDQVLVNLCVNARDAITGVGSVIIETQNVRLDAAYCKTHAGFVPGEYAAFSVSDTGIGIQKEFLYHIFEPFFTTKEIGKGTGLGLSTVYGIVKQNSGFINVYSEPEMGTTFRIYLPRTDVQQETEPEASPQKSFQGTETILLVEDDEAILEIGREILENYGYTVLAASGPKKAMDLAVSHPGKIHLLITDVIMPEMNGQQLWDRLHEMHPQLPVIFMSGYTADVIAHHGVLDKGIQFLQKPFSIPSLAEKVREVLG